VVSEPMTSGLLAKGRFGKQDFVYVSADDVYLCPAGEQLTYHNTNEEECKTLRRYWTTACQACALKNKCTTGKERRTSRWEHDAVHGHILLGHAALNFNCTAYRIDDNDIFGNGVNIAARLEGVAEPGGLCISDDARRQIRAKVDSAFDDMGPQTLKNISEPIRAWRWQFGGIAASTPNSAGLKPALPLPDKPSIAVLPFQNMSGDPEQEYFADGMVEDIVTALSRFKSIFVIARNSSFTYKAKPVDIKQVGRELG
jgi:hypothetical protein